MRFRVKALLCVCVGLFLFLFCLYRYLVDLASFVEKSFFSHWIALVSYINFLTFLGHVVPLVMIYCTNYVFFIQF